MSDTVFWLLFAVAVVAGAVVLGFLHTVIEAAIERHISRALDEPFEQSTHVHIHEQRHEESQAS